MKFQVNTNDNKEVKRVLRDLWDKHVGPANYGDSFFKYEYTHFLFDSGDSHDPICHSHHRESSHGDLLTLEQAITKIVSYKKVTVMTFQQIVEAVAKVDLAKIVARYEELTGNTTTYNGDKDYYEVTLK